MNQTELAKKIGYKSQSMISEILAGKKRMSWEQAQRAARVLGCDPRIFMDRDLPKIRRAFEKGRKGK